MSAESLWDNLNEQTEISNFCKDNLMGETSISQFSINLEEM